jgi:hypothetical protein
MKELGLSVVAHTGWLYTRVHENPLFFFDLWSLVHFWSGFVLMSALTRLAPRRAWLLLGVVLTGWELLELLFIYAALGIFLPETLKDQCTDVLVGLLGGGLCLQVLRWQAGSVRRQHVVAALLVALTLPFLWVGSYGYRYNLAVLNSAGLNWWAFLLWFAASLGLSWHYAVHYRRSGSRLRAVGRTALLYAPLLVAVEYFGYVILGIRETGTTGEPLAFGLIHGSPLLWTAYLAAPLCNTAAFVVAKGHLHRAVAAQPRIGAFITRSAGRCILPGLSPPVHRRRVGTSATCRPGAARIFSTGTTADRPVS